MPQSPFPQDRWRAARRRHHARTLARRREFGRLRHCRASDLVPIQKWVLEWNDLMSMDVHAALTDGKWHPCWPPLPPGNDGGGEYRRRRPIRRIYRYAIAVQR